MFSRKTKKQPTKKTTTKKVAKAGLDKKIAKNKFAQILLKKRGADNKKQPMLFKFFYMCFYLGLGIFISLCFGLWLYSIELTRKYELDDGALGGALWELPSRVYARPKELYIGNRLVINELDKELGYLNYQSDSTVSKPGTYFIQGNEVLIHKQAFGFWDKREPEQLIRLRIKNDKITDLIDMNNLQPISIARLEPLLIGSVYPSHQQDRVLLEYGNIPEVLVDTLVAVEDRRFWQHPGLDAKGLVRALYQAVKNRKVSQGASTITQQFVKNHYLTRERRISRKIKEAIISVILEKKYSKKEVLEGYINEIYLGQDGSRAIHGFGLASQFYFGKDVNELGVHQIASLIALVREPASANPYTRPKYATQRRALILDIMVGQNLISSKDAELAKLLPLDTLASTEKRKKERYFSFLALVYKQLNEHYDKKTLSSGLNIFTSLDPMIQEEAERSAAQALDVLEKRNGLSKNFLQVASVIISSQTAEVVAVVGDRDPSRKGYNRAIQAKRQPGSLLKPAVYLAALEYPLRYNLASQLDDSPLVYKSGSDVWKPKNYSKGNKGKVLLIDSLVKSYNIPTARIGLDLGIDDIVSTLERLGAREGLPQYPSIVLGSVAMSPYEVAQIYETFANGGYRMPLRVIRNVTDAYEQPLERFPMLSIKAISDEPYYLVIKAMQDTVARGTAAKLKQKIQRKLQIAGKTGTTDDYRDSWFAGFSGNYLNVVWVGNDDNKKTKLSGSTGAMRVWMDIMKNLPLTKLDITQPDNVFEFEVDLSNGKLMTEDCRSSRKSANLPFIGGSEPTEKTSCYTAPEIELELESLGNYDDAYSPLTTPNNNSNSWYNTRNNSPPTQQPKRRQRNTFNNSREGSRGGFND